jgi:Rrf2 family transcriptional regulator, iron-sulfur cluster assembly transcription factor
MLVLSKKLYYAIEAVLYIAYNAKADPVSGTVVAEAQNLPTRYLEPMMQKLVRAGILRGVRGPKGGYVLGRERRNITLADICDVIAKDPQMPASSTKLGKTVLLPATRNLMANWHGALAVTNIAQLCERAERANIATASATAHDFTI